MLLLRLLRKGNLSHVNSSWTGSTLRLNLKDSRISLDEKPREGGPVMSSDFFRFCTAVLQVYVLAGLQVDYQTLTHVIPGAAVPVGDAVVDLGVVHVHVHVHIGVDVSHVVKHEHVRTGNGGPEVARDDIISVSHVGKHSVENEWGVRSHGDRVGSKFCVEGDAGLHFVCKMNFSVTSLKLCCLHFCLH